MPESPRASRRPCASSIGSIFHSLHATSQALQPMHTEVSVKKPTRAGWSASYPASPCTSGSGPNSRFAGSRPVKAGLAELIRVTPTSSNRAASRAALLRPGGALHRRPPVPADQAGLHARPPPVVLDELDEGRPAGTAPRADVAGADL